MKKYLGYAGFAVLIAFLAGAVGFRFLTGEAVFGKATTDFRSFATDIIGTKTGTTTVGVAFRTTSTGGQSATTSYVNRIAGVKTNAVYTLKVLAASSTSNLLVDVQGSQDDGCWTIATSTTDAAYSDNLPLTTDINWFSAGDHLKGKVHSTSFNNASSTASFLWSNPAVGGGNEMIFTDLDYECLKLNVSGSSTVAWVQLRSK